MTADSTTAAATTPDKAAAATTAEKSAGTFAAEKVTGSSAAEKNSGTGAAADFRGDSTLSCGSRLVKQLCKKVRQVTKLYNFIIIFIALSK
jgi:hypothetical protein